MISESFERDGVVPILSIPLSKIGCCDRLVWHYNVTGITRSNPGTG